MCIFAGQQNLIWSTKSSEKKNTVNIGHQTDNAKAQKSDLGTVSESGSNLNIALLVIVVIPVVKFI